MNLCPFGQVRVFLVRHKFMSICSTTSLSGGHKFMSMCSTNSSVERHKFMSV